jgi:hypothetical protein
VKESFVTVIAVQKEAGAVDFQSQLDRSCWQDCDNVM